MICVHQLAFNEADVCIEALRTYERTAGMIEDVFLVVDCGFPLPSKDENTDKLIRFCRQNKRFTYVQIPWNEGVAQNWTWVQGLLRVTRGDVLIGMDPDARPQQEGWVRAMADVLLNEPTAAYVGLNRPGFDELQTPARVERQMSGHTVYAYDGLISWSVGGFSGEFLEATGGLDQWNERYGYIEHWAYQRMLSMGKTFYMLKDYYDHHLPSTPRYTEWKKASAEGRTALRFEEWLLESPV